MVVKVMDTKSTIDPPWIGMKQFVPKVVARNQREYLRGAQWPKCGAGDIYLIRVRYDQNRPEI